MYMDLSIHIMCGAASPQAIQSVIYSQIERWWQFRANLPTRNDIIFFFRFGVGNFYTHNFSLIWRII
jgi:hypothetical protein